MSGEGFWYQLGGFAGLWSYAIREDGPFEGAKRATLASAAAVAGMLAVEAIERTGLVEND